MLQSNSSLRLVGVVDELFFNFSEILTILSFSLLLLNHDKYKILSSEKYIHDQNISKYLEKNFLLF